MKRVIIVGGGLAGLSASVFLSEKKYEVTLLEASPKLGGRSYSLFNQTTNDYYDNGQHILMGCYEETIAFLKKINSLDKLTFQDSLKILFVNKGGSIQKLDAPKYFYPFNLLYGILKYEALTLKERLKVIDFFLDLMCCQSCDLKNKTVADWLKCKRQSENAVKSLWKIIVVGALNTTIHQASAELFSEVLKEIFLNGAKSASIVLPNVGLSQLYVEGSVEFIRSHNGKVITSERINKAVIAEDKIIKLISGGSVYGDFDELIFAIPPYALSKIEFTNLSDGTPVELQIPTFQYSPIMNVHLWLKENPFKEKFYGLIDSKIHWVFNHGKHISLTTSAADYLVKLENEEILKQIYSELKIYFPLFNTSSVFDFKIIKEKRATFIPNIESNRARENFTLPFKNLIIAGDWANTGLPSTIESAVLSGKLAAHKVALL